MNTPKFRHGDTVYVDEEGLLIRPHKPPNLHIYHIKRSIKLFDRYYYELIEAQPASYYGLYTEEELTLAQEPNLLLLNWIKEAIPNGRSK